MFNFAYSSCIPRVNKNKPRAGIPGGQFNHCDVDNTLDNFCDPKVGKDNYMTRHHIFDKKLWVDTLNNGLNNAENSRAEAAQGNISKILKEAGASVSVIEDFEQNLGQCKSETNKWLTWLPVNLSLGPAPQDRSFDPANNFDNWALLIVADQVAQNTLRGIHTAVVGYDNNAIAEGLAKLPAVKIPWQMSLGDNANWVRAYDSNNRQKYCPKEIFDKYGMNICPNKDVQFYDMSKYYPLAA